jgi:asparagine synthase (glutamine-hydrolysing)
MHTFLPEDILVNVDRPSMAHLVEVCIAILDHYVSEYAMSLELSITYSGSEQKATVEESRSAMPATLDYRSGKGTIQRPTPR